MKRGPLPFKEFAYLGALRAKMDNPPPDVKKTIEKILAKVLRARETEYEAVHELDSLIVSLGSNAAIKIIESGLSDEIARLLHRRDKRIRKGGFLEHLCNEMDKHEKKQNVP